MSAEYYILRFDPTTGTVQYFSGADWYNVSIADAEVLTTPLTGYSAGAGTISAADTILSSMDKLGATNVVVAARASANTASTLVQRDSSGNFAAGTITATLTGHASLDFPAAGGTLTGPLTLSPVGNPTITMKGVTNDAVMAVNQGGGSDTFSLMVGGFTVFSTSVSTGTLSLASFALYGGNQSIRTNSDMSCGTEVPDAAAILQADSITQGFLPPRMTSTQRDAVATPPKGLMIYNTSTDHLNYYDGAWKEVAHT